MLPSRHLSKATINTKSQIMPLTVWCTRQMSNHQSMRSMLCSSSKRVGRLDTVRQHSIFTACQRNSRMTLSLLDMLRQNPISRVQNCIFRNSSIKPDHPSGISTVFQSIKEEMKHLSDAILHLTLEDIKSTLLRLSAFIGTVHISIEYGFKTYTCEGPSMEPTIIDGSFTTVLVERWSHRLFGLETGDDIGSEIYGVDDVEKSDTPTVEQDLLERFKLEWLPLLKGIWKQHFTSGLQRGDVIILNHPEREGTLCKRIIGMPGDLIVRLDGGSTDTNPVPPGHIWVEGDNPNNSKDSRAYGAVPASLTVGKVVCRLWPLRDYAWVGMDANGMDQWKRISARIGRGPRPMPADGSNAFGSMVIPKE